MPLRTSLGVARRHQTIYVRNEPSEHVYVLCQGWAVGWVQLVNGRKHTLRVLLPGDPFALNMLFEDRLHFSVRALTGVRFTRIRRDDAYARIRASPEAIEALAKLSLAERKAADDLLIDLGRCTAEERIARLFLSLTARLRGITAIRGQRYPFPLRREDIADMLGLTREHVSRVMSRFRQTGLIELSAGSLSIINMPELERISPAR